MPNQQLTSTNLQQFIDNHTIEATILPMAEHTPTVPDAARALRVEPEQIIKSLVFMVNNQPLLIINNGTARVDRKKIGKVLGVNRKKVKFATPEQALEITGFIVGSMPPFGHIQTLASYIDPAIMTLDTIYGGGGDINAMLRLTPTELIRITQGQITEISE